jgi:hypothetical protein
LQQEQLRQHVLLFVPTPQGALHGGLTPVKHAAAGSRIVTDPSQLWMMFAALLVSKETLDLIVVVLISAAL